jgi:hypothetical protein
MSFKSVFTLFTAGLAFASAYTKPVGDAPEGNPISQPGLASVVPVGENFTITWEPTTKGTVTLVLLKGPATDLKLVYPIVEMIPNDGSYVWDPKSDLAPGDTGYGIQLIDDATGQYQYTTQFGISNPDYKPAVSSSSASAYPTTSAASPPSYNYGSLSASASASSTASIAAYPGKANTTMSTLTMSGTAMPYGTGAPSSGYPAGNMTVVPTGSMTVPSSLKTTATRSASSTGGSSATTSPAAPISTGAAANLAASIGGLVVAAGVAVFAL